MPSFSWNQSSLNDSKQVFDVESWDERKQRRREKRQKTSKIDPIVIDLDSTDSDIEIISPPPTSTSTSGPPQHSSGSGTNASSSSRKRKHPEPIASSSKLTRPQNASSVPLAGSSRVKDEAPIDLIESSLWEDTRAIESDSSEDYGWDGYWDPFPESKRLVSDVAADLARMTIRGTKPDALAEQDAFENEKQKLRKAMRSVRGARIQQFVRMSGIAPRWTMLQRERKSNLIHDLNLSGLKLRKGFKRSAGPVMQILQLPGAKGKKSSRDVIITSAALNGTLFQDSDEGGDLSPYNKVGSLLHCKDDQVRIVNGHYRQIQARAKEEYHIRPQGKTYSVNAAALDPCRRDTFVTGGGDGHVILWKVLDEENIDVDDMDGHISLGYGHVADVDEEFVPDGHDSARRIRPSLREDARIEYDGMIQDIRYHPEEKRLIAVGCSDGFIHIYPNISTSRPKGFELRVSPRSQSGHQSAASMAWGTGPSTHFLFSSTEGNKNTFHGYHYAFDIPSGRSTPAYKFSGIDGVEQGDTIGLDPQGNRLAICSITESGTHYLRLFDVRRKQNYATHCIELEPFAMPEEDHNIQRLLFDPVDGLYIALGRADNGIDIYDSRFIGEHKKGLLRRYQHEGSYRPQPQVPAEALHKDNGIVDLCWIVNPVTNRLGLVSGGDDGCVRLWDINKHDEYNSEVLAQMDDAIAAISVGDITQNQYALIVGDYSGSISMFDRAI